MSAQAPDKLQILVCTVADRLGAIDTSGMPELPGVSYIVSCQCPDGKRPDAAGTLSRRGDISVHCFADRGLSRNRNHSLELATAPYILISDDDISYSAEGLQAIIDTFDADPALDIVTTRSVIPEHHVYPPDGHPLDRPCRFYSPISFEIALRRRSWQRSGIRFSELAGIGAPRLTAGEEQIFVHRLLRAGLRGRYIDTVVSHHRGNTTCVRSASTPGVIRAKGAVMRIERGAAAAAIRLPLEAWRSPLAFPKALLYLCQGFAYSIRHRKEL